MLKKTAVYFSALLLTLFLLLSACGAPAETATPSATPQSTSTLINKTFQSQLPAVPKVPYYMCGAWASNRSPSMYGTITIYAKLTYNVKGVADAPATGIVHFASYDAPLGTAVSDNGGYAAFTLSLQGQQPHQTPATIDITFTVQKKVVACSPAFFTPQ
jgi:hypothetical protein